MGIIDTEYNSFLVCGLYSYKRWKASMWGYWENVSKVQHSNSYGQKCLSTVNRIYQQPGENGNHCYWMFQEPFPVQVVMGDKMTEGRWWVPWDGREGGSSSYVFLQSFLLQNFCSLCILGKF
jgi:hypothetical protein